MNGLSNINQINLVPTEQLAVWSSAVCVSASVFNVEENVGQIKVEVKRSAGIFGRVTCHLTTQDGTATSGRKA